MNVFGVERHFLMTVGASAEISKLCPEGNLSKISSVLSGTSESTMIAIAKIICALNRGYETRQKFLGEEYHEPMSVEMVLALSPEELSEIQNEALSAFNRDTKTEIKATPNSKKNKRPTTDSN